MKKLKSENQILLMLACISLSIGLWENFRQLWLEDNGFSAMQISNISSIGSFVSVIGILFVSKRITLDKLKGFMSFTIVIKFLNLVLLYYLNHTMQTFSINVLIAIDITTSYLITTSVYPLITIFVKNNTIYSKRKLTEYLFRDVGILVGGFLIGKSVVGVLVDYNVCLYISIVFLASAMFVMFNMKSCKKVKSNPNPKASIVKYIAQNKILKTYCIYTFIGSMAMSTGLGLKMLTLTNYFDFSESVATNYLVIVGLICDLIGILALKYLTPQNDYITITIKFVIRFSLYTLAFLTDNLFITIIAITWSLLIGAAYENICDGYYINGVENEYQLTFTNFRYIIRYIGEAIGIFCCGLMYEKGLKYMFGLSAFFMIFQIALAYRLIYMRKHMVRVIVKKNPNLQYRERKCVYAIIRDDEGKVAIANDGKYFFFGGGTEDNETERQTLKREMLEETGYTLKDVKLLQKLVSYEYNESRGNLKIVATIFTAKFDQKVTEPTEQDHQILWGNPKEYVPKMYHKYQRVILKEYSENRVIK